MFPTVKTQVNFIGGLGLKIARVMLNLEIYDEELSSSRIMQPKVAKRERTMQIYPNPAKENVSVQLSDKEKIDQLKVMDVTGRVCYSTTSESIINIEFLSPGLYFINVRSKGEEFNGSLIINR